MLSLWNDYGRLGRYNARDYAPPTDAFDLLRREVNRLFFDFDPTLSGSEAGNALGAWPRVSLEDTGSSLVLRAEVPGLSEKDLELTIDGSSLTLKGERKEPVPEGYSTHRKERSAYRFSRSFALPAKIDPDKARAELKHGVLSVTLEKAKEAQPRQIAVSAGQG